jgi:hypothetical protein
LWPGTGRSYSRIAPPGYVGGRQIGGKVMELKAICAKFETHLYECRYWELETVLLLLLDGKPWYAISCSTTGLSDVANQRLARRTNRMFSCSLKASAKICLWLGTDPSLLGGKGCERIVLGSSTNLRYACPKWHAAFPAVPIFLFLLPDQRLCIVKNMYLDTCLTVYRLYLSSRCYQVTLQWIICTKIGAVRSVDWIFSVGALVWRWLGHYCVTLGRTFCSVFKQEVLTAPVISKFSSLSQTSRRLLYVIILCVNYISISVH